MTVHGDSNPIEDWRVNGRREGGTRVEKETSPEGLLVNLGRGFGPDRRVPDLDPSPTPRCY